MNPARIKGFAQSKLSRNKTDKVDAQLIAQFCQSMHPEPWEPKPLYIRELQALVHRLEALQNLYQQEMNRLKGASFYIRWSIEKIVACLSEEIREIKKRIEAHIDQYPDLQNKKELLKSIPGVGEATIMKVLAFISNPEDFKSARQLAAFIGLNPKQRQSGSSVRGYTRLSKVGDSRLRKVFYMPAIVAKQCNPVIKSFCDRLQAAGKPKMLIIGAAMRKLVHMIYGVLKSGKPFDATLAMG